MNLPSGSTAIPVGRAPVLKGVPGTGVSMPVLALTEKAETVFAPWLLTKRNLCTASKAINSAPAPAANGDSLTGESEPDLLTVKTETAPEPEFVTKAKLEGAVGETAAFLLMPQPFSKKIVTIDREDRTNNRRARKPRRINKDESMAFISQILKIKDLKDQRSMIRANKPLGSGLFVLFAP